MNGLNYCYDRLQGRVRTIFNAVNWVIMVSSPPDVVSGHRGTLVALREAIERQTTRSLAAFEDCGSQVLAEAAGEQDPRIGSNSSLHAPDGRLGVVICYLCSGTGTTRNRERRRTFDAEAANSRARF